jgi:hypothetical protein
VVQLEIKELEQTLASIFKELLLKALVFAWALFYAPQCPPLIEESPAASHLKVQRREGNRREKISGHPICDRGGERERIRAGQGCR